MVAIVLIFSEKDSQSTPIDESSLCPMIYKFSALNNLVHRFFNVPTDCHKFQKDTTPMHFWPCPKVLTSTRRLWFDGNPSRRRSTSLHSSHIILLIGKGVDRFGSPTWKNFPVIWIAFSAPSTFALFIIIRSDSDIFLVDSMTTYLRRKEVAFLESNLETARVCIGESSQQN